MAGKISPNKMMKPVTPLGYDGSDFYALKVNADGHLQMDALSSALPSGAATAAKQDTVISRMQDQLFTFKSSYKEVVSNLNANAGGNQLNASEVPAGEVWVVTAILARDYNTALGHVYLNMSDATDNYTLDMGNDLAINEPVKFIGHAYLVEGDYVNVYFSGCAAGDDLYLNVLGYKMTKAS